MCLEGSQIESTNQYVASSYDEFLEKAMKYPNLNLHFAAAYPDGADRYVIIFMYVVGKSMSGPTPKGVDSENVFVYLAKDGTYKAIYIVGDFWKIKEGLKSGIALHPTTSD